MGCCRNERRIDMNTYEKLEWLHCAIQEALNGNLEELQQALEMVEDMREPYLFKPVLSNEPRTRLGEE